MTWTDISPEFKQYEGMTPAEIGREILEGHSIQLVKEQEDSFRWIPNYRSWTFKIDNDDWNEFWSVVYNLENVPEENWSDDEWFAYRALRNLKIYAAISLA